MVALWKDLFLTKALSHGEKLGIRPDSLLRRQRSKERVLKLNSYNDQSFSPLRESSFQGRRGWLLSKRRHLLWALPGLFVRPSASEKVTQNFKIRSKLDFFRFAENETDGIDIGESSFLAPKS